MSFSTEDANGLRLQYKTSSNIHDFLNKGIRGYIMQQSYIYDMCITEIRHNTQYRNASVKMDIMKKLSQYEF